MAQPDKNMMAGEVIAYEARMPKLIFVAPLFYLLIGTCMLMYASMQKGQAGQAAMWLAIPVFAFALFMWSMRLIRYLTTSYLLTNMRLTARVGLFERESFELLLVKVESITVDQPLWGRILGYGSLKITGTGGSVFSIPSVPAPTEFRTRIQEQIHKAQTQ